jgi:hypothetical protein
VLLLTPYVLPCAMRVLKAQLLASRTVQIFQALSGAKQLGLIAALGSYHVRAIGVLLQSRLLLLKSRHHNALPSVLLHL